MDPLLLKKLLAQRLQHDPAQGGSVIPSSQWGAQLPPLPKAPMPQLPGMLPPTQMNSPLPPDLPPGPMSAQISPFSLSNPSGPSPAPQRPPINVDPASVAALGGAAPEPSLALAGQQDTTPDFVKEDVQNGRPFPDFPGPSAPNVGPSLPKPSPIPSHSLSTPGQPLGGDDPSLGMQGPDNMAPPPEPAPLESAPIDPTGALGGQAPQMAIHTATEQGGGGDLVSLIKRLLHKGR